jgi:uncharacterized membrane protein
MEACMMNRTMHFHLLNLTLYIINYEISICLKGNQKKKKNI